MVKTFFIVFIAFSAFLPNQGNNWELKKEADGIKVFTREVENSNIKEFKATSPVNASEAVIFRILQDVANYPQWIEDVQYAEIVATDTRLLKFYYQLTLPWPMKNRDIAMTMEVVENNDGSLTLIMHSTPALVPEKAGFIRMHEVAGKWHLQPIDAHHCQVTYQFLADPEGFLPAWVVNIFIVDGPFKTLQNLNKYAKKFTY